MSFSSQQTIDTSDGTRITFDSWTAEKDQVGMSPGQSRFTGQCPQHGEIDSSYESLTVMFAVRDHARDHHGGLVENNDLLDLGPSIQL